MTKNESSTHPAGREPPEVHNTEINTAAAEAELCGMTHLATGRLCLLPKRHSGGCDFRAEADIEAAIELR